MKINLPKKFNVRERKGGTIMTKVRKNSKTGTLRKRWKKVHAEDNKNKDKW